MHEKHAAISKLSFCTMFGSLDKFATKIIEVIMFVYPLLISYVVQSLVYSNGLLLKYEYFVGTSQFLGITLWITMETLQFHITQMCLFKDNNFDPTG